MNSYIIDANIYSFPDEDSPELEEKERKYQEFIKRLIVLYRALNAPKQDIKLFFFRKDVKSLKKAKKLFSKEKYDKMKEIKKNSNDDLPVDIYLESYSKLMTNLLTSGYNPASGKKRSKYITIEEHLNMTTGSIGAKNTVVCEPDIENAGKNPLPMNDFKKKMLLLAFLNRYIYRDTAINKMVVIEKIPEDKANITADVVKVTHTFLGDDIPEANFQIKKQTIEFCQVDKINSRKRLETITEAYLEAKAKFTETLDFINDEVEKSIAEYEKTVLDLKAKYEKIVLDPEVTGRDLDISKKIKNHIEESPYTLYDHLDSLDKLVKYYKSSKGIAINKRKPIMEEYRRKYNTNTACYDKNTCYVEKSMVCKKCCALLCFCRYDCSAEAEKEEGKIDDKQFRMHLKPYSFGLDGKNKNIAELSLRIYFRWDTDKIEIGYIGKHLK